MSAEEKIVHDYLEDRIHDAARSGDSDAFEFMHHLLEIME